MQDFIIVMAILFMALSIGTSFVSMLIFSEGNKVPGYLVPIVMVTTAIASWSIYLFHAGA